MHGDNAKSHEDAAENEVKRRGALATDDVKAAAGYEGRHHEGKDGQSDVVGHRYRRFEGEHGDEVHRPYSASHRDRGRRQPHATRKSTCGSHVPAEIEGGVRRETGDQNGQHDEIWIVCSGNDHRDRPNFGPETSGRRVHLQVYHNLPLERSARPGHELRQVSMEWSFALTGASRAGRSSPRLNDSLRPRAAFRRKSSRRKSYSRG